MARKNDPTIFFNRDGEVVPVNVSKPERGALYTYLGGFMVVSIDGLRMIRRAGLGKRTRDVLDCLLEGLSGNAACNVTMTNIAAQVGVDASAVSRALSQLETAGIIMRGKVRGVVYLNPHIGFKGTARQQRLAVAEWDASNRPVAVA